MKESEKNKAIKAGAAFQKTRAGHYRIKEEKVSRMVNSVAHNVRQKAEQAARRDREAAFQAQRETELKKREREAAINRILGSTGGYGYWSIGKRTLKNRDTIKSIFSRYDIPVPSNDPRALCSDLLEKLHHDLENAGFEVSLFPHVTVRACAALYWDIELGLNN
ncbi:MAG: hypothetical protein WCX69_04570 [Candidatus Paceibacterota bacterium]